MRRKTVLIVDHYESFADALADRCRELGIEAAVCADALSAFQEVQREAPDMLILEAGAGAEGLQLYEQLLADENLAPIPAIALTTNTDDAMIARCNQLGVHYVWRGLEIWSELEPLVRNLLELPASGESAEGAATGDGTAAVDSARASAIPTVLVVDDDPDVSKAIKIRLRPYGVEVLRAFSGMQGYWTALKERPDAVVIDFKMPEGYGNYLLGKLRTHTLTKSIPVIVLTGQRIGKDKDFALERELISLGASAFLTKPLDFESLKTELRRHISFTENPKRATTGTAGVSQHSR